MTKAASTHKSSPSPSQAPTTIPSSPAPPPAHSGILTSTATPVEWTYSLVNGTDGNASVVQNLAQGESVSDTFTVKVTDDKGGFDTQVVTLTITGTNDDPVISGTAAGAAQEDNTLSATGILTSTDIDNGATASWSIEGNDTGTYGSLALNGNSGEWTYSLVNGTDGNASVVQNLAQGESVSDTFTVKVTDDKGGFDTQVVTLTITGTNDDPVISGTAAGAAQEDNTLSATGILTSTDIDNGATATWSIEGNDTGTYGSLALNGNSGEWTYSLVNGTDGNASVVQNLAQGESVSDTFTVKVTDDKGGFDTQVVTLTITGTNDDPVISGTAAGAAQEDNTLSATGILTSTDIDNGATATWSIEGNDTGTYGSLALNGNSGEWTYSLVNGTDGNASVVQNLAQGESVSDTFTVKVTDDKGGFDTQVVTLTITGTNDDPVISGTAAGAAQEDNTLSATGILTSTDIDNGATATWSIEGNDTGTYGSLALNGNSGEWTYSLVNGTDGNASVVQNLAQGESVSDTFTVKVTDDKGGFDTQVVTLTITGTNDDPVISGTAAGAAQEDNTLSATGILTSTDIDNGATATWSIEGNDTGTYGTYGSLALNGTLRRHPHLHRGPTHSSLERQLRRVDLLTVNAPTATLPSSKTSPRANPSATPSPSKSPMTKAASTHKSSPSPSQAPTTIPSSPAPPPGPHKKTTHSAPPASSPPLISTTAPQPPGPSRAMTQAPTAHSLSTATPASGPTHS